MEADSDALTSMLPTLGTVCVPTTCVPVSVESTTLALTCVSIVLRASPTPIDAAAPVVDPTPTATAAAPAVDRMVETSCAFTAMSVAVIESAAMFSNVATASAAISFSANTPLAANPNPELLPTPTATEAAITTLPIDCAVVALIDKSSVSTDDAVTLAVALLGSLSVPTELNANATPNAAAPPVPLPTATPTDAAITVETIPLALVAATVTSDVPIVVMSAFSTVADVLDVIVLSAKAPAPEKLTPVEPLDTDTEAAAATVSMFVRCTTKSLPLRAIVYVLPEISSTSNHSLPACSCDKFSSDESELSPVNCDRNLAIKVASAV